MLQELLGMCTYLESLAALDHQADVAKDDVEPLPHDCDPVAERPARPPGQHSSRMCGSAHAACMQTHPYTL